MSRETRVFWTVLCILLSFGLLYGVPLFLYAVEWQAP